MAVAELGSALVQHRTTGEPAVDDAVAGARALGVTVEAVRFVDEDPAVTATLPRGRFAAVADVAWRVDGFDRASAHAEVTVLLEQRDGATHVVGFGGGSRPDPLWLSGHLAVRRTPGVVVAGADASIVDRTVPLARRAVAEVGAVLGHPVRMVVEIPVTSAGLDRELGADEGRYAAIAAVTTYVGKDAGPRTPVHVFVNPQVFGGLSPSGAQLVMTHETTHLATDAVHAKSPLWLLEGYADHVALRDTTLPLTRTAGQIGAQVRKEGVPKELPAATAFDAHASHLGAVYEAAWRICEVLAAERGEATLLELYRRTAAGEPVGGVLHALYGFGEEELTRRWQDDLRRIAALPHRGR
ncbi:hypothetical protein [Nocardioides phosphati]|nr:hypothetical protein [Nocardioides phosphati]